LSAEFGQGFDTTNLRHMRGFYLAFPTRDALRRELSWTHYRLLLRVDGAEARQWYVQEATAQNWATRALERQIGSLYYERLLLSQDKAAVTAEDQANMAALEQSPRAFARDPVMLEFLGLPEAGRLLEARLETALTDKLQAPEPADRRAHCEDHQDLPIPRGRGTVCTPRGDGRDREKRFQPEYLALHQHGSGRGGDRPEGDTCRVGRD